MRKLKLFLDAKAANTPPRGISKASRVIFSVLTLLLLSIGQVWGADVMYTFSEHYSANTVLDETGVALDSYTTATFNKRSGGTATQYYTKGLAVRWYGGGTLAITSSKTISKIEITYTQTANSVSADKGTYSEGTWTGSESSVLFTQSGTTGQCRISSIAITYSTGGGDEPGGDEPGGGEEPGGGSGAGDGTVNFGSAQGSINVNAASVSGDDNLGNTWTVTTVGTTSFTPNAAYAQIGSSSKPATSITFTTTLSQEMKVTDFSAKFGGFNGTAGTVTLKVGDTEVGSGSLNAGSDVTVEADVEATGTVLTVTVTNISKGVKAYYISYTVAAKGDTDPSEPTVTSIDILTPPTKDTYYSEETIDLTGIIVKATLSDNSEENPVDISKLSASAIAKAADKLNVEQPITVTYGGQSDTYNITLIPYTPVGAAALIPNVNNTKNDIYTEGIVTRKLKSDWNPEYGNILYWISEDGTTTDEMEVYRGKDLGNVKFENFDDLKEGDKVIVYGNLKNYSGTKEYLQNNYLISHTARELSSLAISGNLTETSYNLNATELNYAGLTVNATYQTGYIGDVTADVEWSIEPATLSTAGDEIAVTITASYTENNVNKTASKNVIVSVSDKVLTSITIPDNYSANIYCGQEIPKPTVTAHFDDLSTSDVTEASTLSEVDILTPGVYNVTVSYTYGDVTKTAEFELTLNAYSVADVQNVIPATGEISTAVEGVIRWIGYVNANSFAKYSISATGSKEDSDTLLIYNSYAGKDINGYINFVNTDDIEVGDKVIVSGKFTTYNGTKETKTKESYISSLIKKSLSSLAISGSLTTTVYELNDDIDVDGLVVTGTYNTGYEQDVTAGVTWTSDPEHLSTAGESVSVHLTATIGTISDETDVTVKVTAPAQKYAITFDGNGADGGNAPEAIADKAAGAEVTLPANSYTKTGYVFDGWKVYDENQDEVTVTAGAFEMPASAVVIKAQWAEISVWATTYTSNVELSYTGTGESNSKVIISEAEYPAQKVGSGNNDGSVVVTVPSGTHTLHFHAVAWNGKSVTITASGVENMSVSSFTLIADAGFKASGTYTLENDPVDQYFAMTFDAVAEETQITFSKTDGDDRRFLLYGVNQEGGILPVLESIEISGDLTTKSYKAGDALDLDGLTVNAIYSLGGTPQTPVDITDDAQLEWSYAPLVENQTSITITATYKGQTDDITITDLVVTSADPKIYVSTLNVNFASVEVGDAVPAAETVTVTLTNVASVTATLGGTNADAFSVSPASLTESGDITISILANTDAAASYSATLTISDGEGGADDKTINLSFTVNEPVTPEDPEVRKTWDLSIASYDANPTEEQVTWSATYVNMVADKANSTTAANNYLGGDANNRTSSRFYKNSTLTITPNGKEITSIVFTATSTSYANALQGSEWTNASASVDGTTVTVTPTDGKNAIIAVVGGTCGFTSVQVNYKNIAPEPPTPSTPDYTRGVTAGNYGTICLPKAGVIEGATLFEIAYKGGGLIYVDEILNGEMEAGVPYIFYATSDQLSVVYDDNTVAPIAATDANGLHGFYNLSNMATDEADKLDLDKDQGNYILYNNQYWLVSGRAAYINNFRAYIKLGEISTTAPTQDPGAAPRRRVAMTVNGEQTTTDIDALNASETPVKMIIDGQLFIIRGEKMYNVNGQVVK